MAIHVVQPGECLATIAASHGYFWQTLWDHPDNAKLKRLRKNPGVLFAGDVVRLPKKEMKKLPVTLGKPQSFKVKRVRARLCVRLVVDGKPLKNEPYTLEVEGQLIKGQTDGDGLIDQPVPLGADTATLMLDMRQRHYTLRIGHLDPASEVSGVQARLQNLGHYQGQVDGKLGPLTAEAVRQFQSSVGLTATGKIDASLAAKLVSVHGS